MSENTDLVQYEEQLKRELAQLKDNVEAPSSNRISTKGKVFTLPDGRKSPGPLVAIVLDFIGINQWWQGVYNANVRAPADCFAIDRVLKNLAPPVQVAGQPKIVVPSKPQAARCEICPKNQWGTGVNGTGKACKNQRRLLIVAPDFDDKTQPMTLQVSPTGIKHWDKYVRDVASDHGAMPVQMITSISFDPNQSYPTLLFDLFEEQPKHGKLGLAMHLRAKYAEMLYKAPEAKQDAA